MNLPETNPDDTAGPSRFTMVALALLGCAAAGLLGFKVGSSRDNPGPSPAAQGGLDQDSGGGVGSPAPLTPELARGRDLSKVYCVTCHVYPEPEILDRYTWAMETLPRMAFWVGHAEYDLSDEPGIGELREAGLLPTGPLMSLEDWQAVGSYYLHAAPARAKEIEREPTAVGLTGFTPRIIPAEGPGLTSLVRIVPKARKLLLGAGGHGAIEETTLEGKVLRSFPVDSLAVDAARTADGWEVCLVGSLPPADVTTGRLVFVPDSPGTARPLLDGLRRPVQSLAADLDGDGRRDRVLNQFGNILGGLSVAFGKNGLQGAGVPLAEQPGAARSAIADFNGDGKPDIVVAFSQAREAVTVFLNGGDAGFAPVPVANYPPAWGNVFVDVLDFNGDGRPDLLTCNGDSGDFSVYPSPRRAYHGVRVLLHEGLDADGAPKFREAFFFAMYGAYRALARDYDEDGDLDIAACSFYPDYPSRPQESFVYLENQGGLKFSASTFAESLSGRWIGMDAADADGDGDIDIALASFVDGPGRVPEKLSRAWDENGAAAVFLENRLR